MQKIGSPHFALVFLADASLEDKVLVYSCMSSATNVYQTAANGEDQVDILSHHTRALQLKFICISAGDPLG